MYLGNRGFFVIIPLKYNCWVFDCGRIAVLRLEAGKNVNMDWLDRNGYWASQGQYPTEVRLSKTQLKEILAEGNVNVSNVIIDQP